MHITFNVNYQRPYWVVTLAETSLLSSSAAPVWSLAVTAVLCDSLLQKWFNMTSTEHDEVDEDCETLDAVESASGGFEYSEAELKFLTEKWSRYSVAYF